VATAEKTKPQTYEERNRTESAARSRRKSAANRDIGELPPVKNPARKEQCRQSLGAFARAYFPHTFTLPFCPDHDAVIAKIELAVTKGGLFALAMPRGSGKTTLCEVAAIWAILYGYHSFIVLIGSDIDAAVQMLNSIKVELDSNDLLADDFPEVCFPIAALEGEARRCKGQTYRGERTQSQWSDKTIVMPTIPGSKASGVIVRTAGITGKVRGLKFKRPDGQSVRPTLVLVDDPQTDESANSVSQCQTRERTLSGAVLGLAGPGKRIAGIMPCTVIREGDLADRMLDPKKHPEWNGSRFQLVYEFPKNRGLWDDYKAVMDKFSSDLPGDRERAFADATSFYFDHADDMNEGARVAWLERYDPQELSAIQHCMNLLFRDERAFWAEYQNKPLPEVADSPNAIKPDDVLAKLNGAPRGVVPVTCAQLTAFIDVQGDVLFWLVAAWAPGFSGAVIDYGSYPGQRMPYFTLAEVKVTLADVAGGAGGGLERNIYDGLASLTADILGRDWPRQDGSTLRVERCMIDANWGDSTAVVRQFCRESPFRSVLFPSHGKGVGASSQPMSERAPKDGERLGLNWFIPFNTKSAIRQVIYDTNFWKSFAALRIKSGMGQGGTLSLFGDSRETHRMIADHWASETPERVKAERTGRTVDEWRAPPGVQNHWWDCLVGAFVAASIQGVSLDGVHAATKQKQRPKMSMAEMRQKARRR
jgi:energy-coupling factor transporter ATP-binding protein EcfA2